jgi:hypothetical protein
VPPRKFAVFPTVLGSPDCVFDEHILSVGGESLLLFSPPKGNRATWRRAELLNDAQLAEMEANSHLELGIRLLVFRKRIYNPAFQSPVDSWRKPYWRRIDPKTRRVERVNDETAAEPPRLPALRRLRPLRLGRLE